MVAAEAGVGIENNSASYKMYSLFKLYSKQIKYIDFFFLFKQLQIASFVQPAAGKKKNTLKANQCKSAESPPCIK